MGLRVTSFTPLYLPPGGTPASHEVWQQSFRLRATDGAGAPTQKTFKVLDPRGMDEQVHEIDISMMPAEAGEGDSSAEKTGYLVDVRYRSAPDVVLFSGVFPNEELAKKVMDDLATASATVEGLIRQADFDGAKTAMQDLAKLFKSASAEPPTPDTEGGTK